MNESSKPARKVRVRRRAATGVPLTVALALTVAACGGSSSGATSAPTTSASSSSSTSGASSLLPSAIRSAGVLHVGTTVGYPPSAFVGGNNHTVVGFDADLIHALAANLGVKADIKNTAFASLVTGLQAHRYDMVESELADTKAREQAVDFIDYFQTYAAILVAAGNPQHISSLQDLCGKTVAVETGAEEVQLVQDTSAKCGSKGKIKILTFPSDADAQLQVQSGRAVADVNDSAELGYVAKTVGGGKRFQLADYPNHQDVGPSGIAVPKDDTMLRTAIQTALKHLIANGTYQRILAKWGVSSDALTTGALNGATS